MQCQFEWILIWPKLYHIGDRYMFSKSYLESLLLSTIFQTPVLTHYITSSWAPATPPPTSPSPLLSYYSPHSAAQPPHSSSRPPWRSPSGHTQAHSPPSSSGPAPWSPDLSLMPTTSMYRLMSTSCFSHHLALLESQHIIFWSYIKSSYPILLIKHIRKISILYQGNNIFYTIYCFHYAKPL